MLSSHSLSSTCWKVRFKFKIDSGAEEDIPLYNVKMATLKKIVEFLTYIKENPLGEIDKPLKSANLHEVVPAWFADFVEVE